VAKVWFIPGASRGFGRQWTEAAVERDDRVAPMVHDPVSLKDVASRHPENSLPIQLDVTDREGAFAAVQLAADRLGRLDVVVNNAGYGHFGTVEELTEAEVRAQMETIFSVRCGSPRRRCR
jgi:NAD(P)-dependent dehydrogenase (short-subunit alcohol dehydrogenase family)